MTPEIKEKLLGLINEKAYNPLKKEELALIFDIHSCEMPLFNNFLEELQDEGYLIISKKGRVMAPSAMGYFVGKFISHRKGFGFVESDEEFTQDLFIGPDDINIDNLIKRCNNSKEKIELIIALKPTIEGETTLQYINKLLKNKNVEISRLSYGIPVGTEIDYLDALTLERAFEDRRNL